MALTAAQLIMRAATGQTQTLDMDRTGPRAFQLAVEHIRTGFTYRIVTEAIAAASAFMWWSRRCSAWKPYSVVASVTFDPA